jgi:hypothetical protein
MFETRYAVILAGAPSNAGEAFLLFRRYQN